MNPRRLRPYDLLENLVCCDKATRWGGPARSTNMTTMGDANRTPLQQRVREIGRSTLATFAGPVDAEARFPSEAIDQLRNLGLMAFLVPSSLGGMGASYADYASIAATLAEECLATAMVWTMHTHMVATLRSTELDDAQDTLRAVAGKQELIASVTTEFGKKADIFTAQAPLLDDGKRVIVRRRAPIVSYGLQASYYLATMRSSEEATVDSVRLVLLRRDDTQIKQLGQWKALGMRGTCSVPMELEAVVPHSSVSAASFERTIRTVLIPSAFLGWGACWLGGVRGLFSRVASFLHTAPDSVARSELTLDRLARARTNIATMHRTLSVLAEEMDNPREGEATDKRSQWADSVNLTTVKLSLSETAVQTVALLEDVLGFRGYADPSLCGIDRVRRDIASARYMYNNDTLLHGIGLVELVSA